MNKMKNKKIIVTGASRGIGFELVKLFALQNHQVLALSRNTESLIKLQASNNTISVLQLDIAAENEYSKVSDFVNDRWNEVDILIHNAGKLINKTFNKTSTKDFLDIYRVNVFGVAGLTKTILPFFKSGSHVVAISSMGGIQGSIKFPGLSAYSSSKGAVITLMELLAEQQEIWPNILRILL